VLRSEEISCHDRDRRENGPPAAGIARYAGDRTRSGDLHLARSGPFVRRESSSAEPGGRKGRTPPHARWTDEPSPREVGGSGKLIEYSRIDHSPYVVD